MLPTRKGWKWTRPYSQKARNNSEELRMNDKCERWMMHFISQDSHRRKLSWHVKPTRGRVKIKIESSKNKDAIMVKTNRGQPVAKFKGRKE